LVELVERMMAKCPAARYQTAAEVAVALSPWCQLLPETVAWARPRQTMMRRLLVCCTIGAALVLGVGGITYLVVHNPSSETAGAEEKRDRQPQTPEQSKPQPPDLTKLRPVFDDDFAEPAKSVLQVPGRPLLLKEVTQDKTSELFFEEGRFVIRLLPRELGTCGFSWALQRRGKHADFACLLRCRFSGQGDVGWAFLHNPQKDPVTVVVGVSRDGAVEVMEFDRADSETLENPKYGKFPGAIAGPDGELTTLLVTLRGRKLTVFVNGRAACGPILLERGFGPGAQGMAVWGRGNREARAEFTRFALWRLPETGSAEEKESEE
jgi:hypothetical protein